MSNAPMNNELMRKILGCAIFYLSVGALVLIVFLVARSYGVAFFALTKDPFAGSADTIPVYTSILSHFGIMLWCFSTAIQFFAAWAVRQRDPQSRSAAFLYWSGWITLVLMLDDFLMLHERMSHEIETVVFGGYGLIVAIILWVHRQVIFRTNYLILASALVCFLLSMVLDNILTRFSIEIPYRTMLEDAFKIIGIVGWTYYYIGFARRLVMADRVPA